MAAPALLVAARAKYLTSQDYYRVMLEIGDGPSPIDNWVFAESDPRTGLPSIGPGKSSVLFYLRSGSWHVNGTTARFPRLAASVWAQGDPATHDAEYQARDVAESLISCFDDPANSHEHQWTPSVYVAHSRWSGELAVFEAENMEGTYRAEVSFEIELV